MKKANFVYFKQFELGPMQNLIYIVADLEAKVAAIIDPAWNVPFLMRHIAEIGCTLSQVWLTHGHHDHVNGLPELILHQPQLPVYLSEHEAPYYTPNVPNLIKIPDQATLTIGAYSFTCIHTPGHTPGGQCFDHHPILITGDTLFVNGCGRCDLPGGDPEILMHSLKKLKELPDDTQIYPGHSYSNKRSDTLSNQKNKNPYLRKIG